MRKSIKAASDLDREPRLRRARQSDVTG